MSSLNKLRCTYIRHPMAKHTQSTQNAALRIVTGAIVSCWSFTSRNKRTSSKNQDHWISKYCRNLSVVYPELGTRLKKLMPEEAYATKLASWISDRFPYRSLYCRAHLKKLHVEEESAEHLLSYWEAFFSEVKPFILGRITTKKFRLIHFCILHRKKK